MDEYKAPKLKIKKIDTSKVKAKEARLTDADRATIVKGGRMTDADMKAAKSKKAKYRKQKKPAKMNIIDARAQTQEYLKEGMEMMRLEREKKMKKYFQGK